MTTIVKAPFRETPEAIEYHFWWRDNCRSRVVVNMIEDDSSNDLVPVTEYNSQAGHIESLQAYSVCEVWLSHHHLGGYAYHVQFDDKGEAMLFKLTFGGR